MGPSLSLPPITPILRGASAAAGAAFTQPDGPTQHRDTEHGVKMSKMRQDGVFRPVERMCSEKVSSLGKDWHKFCLKCERCNKTLNPGGHAEVRGSEQEGRGSVNIGGAGSYVYEAPVNEAPAAVSMETDAKPEEKKAPARGPVKAASFSSFSGGPNICPRCNKTVYFGKQSGGFISHSVHV
ncbi:hypothetical protein FQN60_015438 [Etheostoma spectabile]|uniref:LIM zinc-binding domain-containing protein n=1 Tax=Etheostoma spectabile TaxID=54343 RepID=A0A5J5CLY1_9PERO|nr:hypothetical protein FQN60_015438 [Etheostoma spectabile]